MIAMIPKKYTAPVRTKSKKKYDRFRLVEMVHQSTLWCTENREVDPKLTRINCPVNAKWTFEFPVNTRIVVMQCNVADALTDICNEAEQHANIEHDSTKSRNQECKKTKHETQY